VTNIFLAKANTAVFVTILSRSVSIMLLSVAGDAFAGAFSATDFIIPSDQLRD
jgi:hypothetical protein